MWCEVQYRVGAGHTAHASGACESPIIYWPSHTQREGGRVVCLCPAGLCPSGFVLLCFAISSYVFTVLVCCMFMF